MELHQLRYLRAVVREGSMTRAAELEHVAQPSISKQMRQLELELGVPLFHRVGRRVVPTGAAEELAECAGRVLDDIEATATAVAGPGSRLAGNLRLCATETVANNLLPGALARLGGTFPGARVTVEMLGTDDAIERLVADEADLALVVLPLVDSRLEVRPLLEEDVLLAVPPEHAWAERDAVPLADALRAPGLLLSMPGHGLRAQVDEAADALGIVIRPGIEMRSQQALLSMVAAGGGVAFAPRMSIGAGPAVAAKELRPGLRRQLGWARRRGRHLPAIALALLEILGDQAGSIVAVSEQDSSRSR